MNPNACYDCGKNIPTSLCGIARGPNGEQLGILCLPCKEARDPGSVKRGLSHPNIALEAVSIPGPIGRG